MNRKKKNKTQQTEISALFCLFLCFLITLLISYMGFAVHKNQGKKNEWQGKGQGVCCHQLFKGLREKSTIGGEC